MAEQRLGRRMISALALILADVAEPKPEPEIVITGRSLPHEPVAEHRLVLGRERLDMNASGRMEDALRSIAGLTSFRRSDGRSTHPTAQGMTARGLGGNAASRFAVEVDGVPQADPFGGWINFTTLNPRLVDRVMVGRGAQAGVRFGPGALAGSLAFDSVASADWRAGAAVGSRESVDLWATGGADIGSSRLIGAVAYNRGDGFHPILRGDRGAVDRAAPYKQASGRLRLLVPVGGVELQANVSAFDDQRERGTDFTDNRGRGIDGSVRLVGHEWSLLSYVQNRKLQSEFASVGAGRAGVTPALDQYDVPSAGWGARALWQPRVGLAKFGLGADLRGTEGTTNERYFFNTGAFRRAREAGAKIFTGGMFTDVNWRGERTNVGAGLRVDHWSISDADLKEWNIGGAGITDARYDDRDGWQWSARGSVEQRLDSAWSVRAAAYRSWRLPTINELVRPFRVGPDATAANVALKPEKLVGLEAGLDWKPAPHATLSATIYANRLDDAVTNVTLGHGPGTFPGVGFVAANGLYRRRENVDAIRAYGLELDGDWRRGDWAFGGSIAWTHARIDDNGLAAAIDGKRPAQVPALQASLRAGWERDRRKAGLALRYVGKQDEQEGDAKALPVALTMDAVASWPLSRRLSLDLRGENLFNRRVITSILNDGTREQASPRTLWIGLSFN